MDESRSEPRTRENGLGSGFELAFSFIEGDRYRAAEDVFFAFGDRRFLGSANIGYVAEFFEMTQSMCGDGSIVVYVAKGKNPCVVKEDSPCGSTLYAGHPSFLGRKRR